MAGTLTELLPRLMILVAFGLILIFILLKWSKVSKFIFGFDDTKTINAKIVGSYSHGRNALMADVINSYYINSSYPIKILLLFSVVFSYSSIAAFGFAAWLFLSNTNAPHFTLLNGIEQSAIALVAGLLLALIAIMFFTQWNRSRNLTSQVLIKLREEQKFDETLNIAKEVAKEIENPLIASRVRAIIALSFSDVPMDRISLSQLFAGTAPATGKWEGAPDAIESQHGKRPFPMHLGPQ